MPSSLSTNLQDDSRYMLSREDLEWAELQPFLLKRGYQLPPRYRPNWKPSWKKRRLWGSKLPWHYADASSFYNPKLVDAVRVSDRKKVVLKRVNPQEEVAALEYLHSPELEKDPRNNTVPLLDVIRHPERDDIVIIVMPMLYLFESPSVPFEFVSEILEALDQFLKGLEFLHEQQIAHRDACMLNLMMDATKVLPGGFHFAEPTCKPGGKGLVKPRSRSSVGPIKYYFIDYELALYYPGNEHDSYGRMGQDKTVPEFADEHALYDPFKLDVYQMGGVVQQLIARYGLSFLEDLEAQMRCRDPGKRPTAAEAYNKFSDIVKQLPPDEKSRKITRKPKEIGEPILRGPEKYEKPADSEAFTNSSQQINSLDSPHARPADTLDTNSAEVAGPIVRIHVPGTDSSIDESTMPAEGLHIAAQDTCKLDLDHSAFDISQSFDTSFSAISLHSDTATRSIHTTQSIDTAPTSIEMHDVASACFASGTHSIRTAQSIDTMPTSVGSAQSQHIAEDSQIVDTTKPEAPSPPSEPPIVPLVSPHMPSPASAAGPAKSIPTTRRNHRWWTFLFTNIKRSFRS
ncbi:hypothetical protein D9613_009889 [Agrocybe pediades]|uniref:Protein kinase domain-containing protein n=1 Tax=Agrocybe pediades TaxID=84607 RepID=A0A8H4QVV1_9AGAR|nr:hypothetical protein D9613_009889 [Agrocybe pediades]